MNVNAANSLLKSLEEPPEHMVFILLSTEPERLLDTIHSRCLRLTFAGDGRARFGEEELAWLGEFARMAAEGKKDCFGRYRLLGTLLARLEEMKSAIEIEVEESSPLHDYDEVGPELREQWENQCKAAASAEYRLRRAGYLGALQGWLRDVWLHSAGVSSELALFPNLDYTAEAVADRLSPADAVANLHLMEQTQRTLHTNVQELVALETGLLKLKL